MQVVSFSEAHEDLEALLDTVATDCSIVVIRRRDHEDAVVMSLANYNSLMDTMHLLSSRANREHLAKSMTQFRNSAACSFRLGFVGRPKLQGRIGNPQQA
jgi:antitoxin YefM